MNIFYHTTKLLLAACCLLIPPTTAFSFDPGNWTQLQVTGRHLLDVQMLDFNTIVAVGGNRTNDAITSVFRSDDRGENWAIIIDVPYSPWLQAVHFPTTEIGFAAGHDGMVIRTDDGGISWDTLQLPGNAALRDYNDVYFTSATKGFLVGGNQSNDAIRTILKTVDGGNTWQIIEDGLNPWLKAIQFVSSTVGFASGELGTILKTTDGGDTWTELSLSGNFANRHYNDIRFSNELNGFAVGGNEQNDSIRTILRTNDGGISWQPMLDNVASWLNAIEISPSGDLIAVGNDSTILTSTDGGDTWVKELIPSTINWGVHLNAVDFIYGTLGVVVGNYGQMLLYEGNLPNAPTVTINSPLIASTDSVFVSGTVCANGNDADVFFDFGPTPSFGSTITANPNLVTGTDTTYVEALVTGITAGTYYYRIRAENDGGFAVSETRQLYIGSFYDDANLDFELWNERDYHLLREWKALDNIYSSSSYNGTVAVTLTGGVDSTSAIIIGEVDDSSFPGGFPVSATPDSIVGYFNYTISSNTEALILLVLKKNGVVLSTELNTFSGSSNGEFERLSFPITYAGIEIPDTIILGFANNNPLSSTPVLDPENVVTIDDVHFISSVNIPIPNSDFELWDDVVAIQPANWFSLDWEQEPALNETVFRTEDAQHGNYALILKNNLQYDESGRLYTSNENNEEWGKFAIAARHATFNGYYKYEMLGNLDTVNIGVEVYTNGQSIGSGYLQITESVSSYTPFEIRIEYHSAATPDSANIRIRIAEDSLVGPSVLYIDNLSFDGFLNSYVPPLNTSIDEPITHQVFSVLVYPNPSNGNITVESTGNEPISQLAIFDIHGRLVKQYNASTHHLQLDMSNEPAGIYFLRMRTKNRNGWLTKKLILN